MFRSLRTFLYGLGLGAWAMYLYDPEQGHRRRALLRDQAVHQLNRTDAAFARGMRDLSNRASGRLADSRALIRSETVDDQTLTERVRSKIGGGSIVSHPRAIQVTAHEGRVTLSGPILAHEVEPLAARVAAVRGVRGVENQLEIHTDQGEVPALQGEPAQTRTAAMSDAWAPGPRLMAVLVGGLLTLSGLRRGGLMGTLRSFIGFGLLARSMTNRSLAHLKEMPGGMAGPDARQQAYLQVSQVEAGDQPARQKQPAGTTEQTQSQGAGSLSSQPGSEDRTASPQRDSGMPGGGQGRSDEVGETGVYPASAPDAPSDAQAHGMASWGQGERGAAGYEDSGDSELSGLGEETTDLGSMIPGPDQLDQE